ncbi:LOW QUALITY PROTEIN: hypothetical protein PHMEG_00026257 [Phytophthora megakarya]|uniref:Necrosis inducing protein NPP1 n=1 Tax=Phytophthora megakarya TaxID=4795 RepID=A0A225VCK8_9STRA|nr:LOW QUALITY PROTEIN: hypothetical protein PHMEG_00026257 [Phytophthora megakarya]
MKLRTLATLFAVLAVCATATVDHDKIEPFPQPEPVTVSEKAAIKFKPQLATSTAVCVSFPAVNVAGEITGGLKGTNGNDACKYAPKGSQIYGRSGWYRDVWPSCMLGTFQKGFRGLGSLIGAMTGKAWLWGLTILSWSHRKLCFLVQVRHQILQGGDWQSVVVWIDNPALESSKIVGVSLSKSDTKYYKETTMMASYFAGYQTRSIPYGRSYRSEVISYGSDTTLRFAHYAHPNMDFSTWDGEFQGLIMWEQLTDAAREALSNSKNFGDAKVPFSEEECEKHLDKAWPF